MHVLTGIRPATEDGMPTLPYESDYGVDTILTRSLDT
jgi:hypothetical protein